MKEKLNKIVNWVNDDERLEMIIVIFYLINVTIMEVLGLVIAINMKNYFLLSIYTSMLVCMMVECFVKGYWFKKLDYFLIKKPKISNLVLCIGINTSIILSWKYFIAFIFCIIFAIIYGEVSKLKRE